MIIPVQYDDAEDFREGLAVVNISGKYGYIDKAGHVVISSPGPEDTASVQSSGRQATPAESLPEEPQAAGGKTIKDYSGKWYSEDFKYEKDRYEKDRDQWIASGTELDLYIPDTGDGKIIKVACTDHVHICRICTVKSEFIISLRDGLTGIFSFDNNNSEHGTIQFAGDKIIMDRAVDAHVKGPRYWHIYAGKQIFVRMP